MSTWNGLGLWKKAFFDVSNLVVVSPVPLIPGIMKRVHLFLAASYLLSQLLEDKDSEDSAMEEVDGCQAVVQETEGALRGESSG